MQPTGFDPVELLVGGTVGMIEVGVWVIVFEGM
jgi:hypothetical protein